MEIVFRQHDIQETNKQSFQNIDINWPAQQSPQIPWARGPYLCGSSSLKCTSWQICLIFFIGLQKELWDNLAQHINMPNDTTKQACEIE